MLKLLFEWPSTAAPTHLLSQTLPCHREAAEASSEDAVSFPAHPACDVWVAKPTSEVGLDLLCFPCQDISHPSCLHNENESSRSTDRSKQCLHEPGVLFDTLCIVRSCQILQIDGGLPKFLVAMTQLTDHNNNHHSVPPSAMPLISPPALLHAHLAREPPIRPSGRGLTQCRPISLNSSSLTHANGSALVRIGDTTVVCGVRAEILPVSEIANYRVKQSVSTSPTNIEKNYSEVADLHLLVPNIELSTGCSPNHLPGNPPSTEAQSLSQRLLSLLHTTQLVPVTDLQIYYDPPPEVAEPDEPEPERELKAYWTLYIDTLVISYGGGLFDAAWMAIYAALRDTILPMAWWDIDLGKVICSPEVTDASRLHLLSCPVPMSFGLFVPEKWMDPQANTITKWVLCDLDTFEEGCCPEKGTIAVDKVDSHSWNLVKIEKSGGRRASMADMKKLVDVAHRRWGDFDSILQAAFKGQG